jgi:hypothetical protein
MEYLHPLTEDLQRLSELVDSDSVEMSAEHLKGPCQSEGRRPSFPFGNRKEFVPQRATVFCAIGHSRRP